MTHHRVLVTIFWLLSAGCGISQVAEPLPRVILLLPPDRSSDRVEIRYVLYGSFGASGRSITVNSRSRSVEIQASEEGKLADHIKLFVWVPGCNIATFEIAISEFADVQEPFSCSPLSTITLFGQIGRANQLPKKPREVRIDYLAPWACRFFGFEDCSLPQISLGTVVPKADGAFQIDLPDFALDPVSTDSDGGAELQLVLREVKTGNLMAYLDPELETLRTPSGDLGLAASYPQPVVFVAQKLK